MLKTRIITAIFLVTFFLLSYLFAPPTIWALIFLLISSLAVWEWGQFYQLSPQKRVIYSAIFAVFGCLIIYNYLNPANFQQIIFNEKNLSSFPLKSIPFRQFSHVIYSLVLFIWLIFVPLLLWKKWRLPNIFGRILGLVMILATWLAIVELKQLEHHLLLLILLAIWLADIAAYFTGRKFGRHKLAINISPGKTWEGAAGAVLFVSLYCVLIGNYLHWQILPSLIVAVFITYFSIIGDLFESLLKRQNSIKDSSNLVPGHGGVLDRIDSQLSVLPVCAFIQYYSI